MGDYICADPIAEALIARGRRLAPSLLPILLSGETGTGKEALAREIHRNGRGGPFVVLDCSVLNCETARSEIFGSVRGAYTGAVSDRPGLVDQAEGGTLFVDEIGEACPALQLLLLRLLQSGEYCRVGDNQYRCSDVRFIAATNRDLVGDVASGRFREDLLFRINVGNLRIPPLRERKLDIPVLFEYFLTKHGGPNKKLEPEERFELVSHNWPGNARELENSVLLFLVGGWAEVRNGTLGIEAEDAQSASWQQLPYKSAKKAAYLEAMKAYVEARLIAFDGNVTEAAKSAGIGRQYFQSLARKVGLNTKLYRRSRSFQS